MIEFKCTYKQQSDMGSSMYDVVLDKDYTVKEFVDTILKERPKEWGYFGIYDDNKSYGGDPQVEYTCGEFREQFPDIYLNQKVTKVRASGSWGCMNYIISIESPRVGELESKAQKKARETREAWEKVICK